MKRSDFASSDSAFTALVIGFFLMVTGCAIAVHLKNLIVQNCVLLAGIAAYIYAMAVITYLTFRRETPRIIHEIGSMVTATAVYAIVLYWYSWGNIFAINRKEIGIGMLICLGWLCFLSFLSGKKPRNNSLSSRIQDTHL